MAVDGGARGGQVAGCRCGRLSRSRPPTSVIVLQFKGRWCFSRPDYEDSRYKSPQVLLFRLPASRRELHCVMRASLRRRLPWRSEARRPARTRIPNLRATPRRPSACDAWQGPGKFPSEPYLVPKQKVREFPVRAWAQGDGMEPQPLLQAEPLAAAGAWDWVRADGHAPQGMQHSRNLAKHAAFAQECVRHGPKKL